MFALKRLVIWRFGPSTWVRLTCRCKLGIKQVIPNPTRRVLVQTNARKALVTFCIFLSLPFFFSILLVKRIGIKGQMIHLQEPFFLLLYRPRRQTHVLPGFFSSSPSSHSFSFQSMIWPITGVVRRQSSCSTPKIDEYRLTERVARRKTGEKPV